MAETFRLRFHFWLDVVKPEENEVAAEIEQLKADRLFTKTVRDGIRLIVSLRRHDTTVLFELFPWMKDNRKGGNGGNGGKLEAMQEQLNRMEQLLLQNGIPFTQDIRQQKALPAPEPDDRADLLQIKAVSSEQRMTAGRMAAQNLFRSMEAVGASYRDNRERTPGGLLKMPGADVVLPPPDFAELENIQL